ncbi:MAG: amino acid transport protein [Planctomycetes bacterium]|nr:amino acid transport protein [Planctomycetota bacterium]
MGQASLCMSVVVSSIGAGVCLYGRRQRRGLHLLVGFVLCFYPYFVESAPAMGLIGAGLLGILWLGPRLGVDF